MKKSLVSMMSFLFFFAVTAIGQSALGNCAGAAGFGAAIGAIFGGSRGIAIGSAGGCAGGILQYKLTEKAAKDASSASKPAPTSSKSGESGGQNNSTPDPADAPIPDLSGKTVVVKFGQVSSSEGIPQLIEDHLLHQWSRFGAVFVPPQRNGAYNTDPCVIPGRNIVCIEFGPPTELNSHNGNGSIYVPGVNVGSSRESQQYVVNVTVYWYDNGSIFPGPNDRQSPTINYLATIATVGTSNGGSSYMSAYFRNVGYQSSGGTFANPQLAYLDAAVRAVDFLTAGHGWLPSASATLAATRKVAAAGQ